MSNRIPRELNTYTPKTGEEANKLIDVGINHLKNVQEMFRLDQFENANIAMGNALSYLDEVQAFLDTKVDNDMGGN